MMLTPPFRDVLEVRLSLEARDVIASRTPRVITNGELRNRLLAAAIILKDCPGYSPAVASERAKKKGECMTLPLGLSRLLELEPHEQPSVERSLNAGR